MPYWSGSTDANSPVADEWNRFYSALKVHEDGHGEIAIRAGDAIENKVSQLGSFSVCSELESRVNQVSRAELDKYKRHEF